MQVNNFLFQLTRLVNGAIMTLTTWVNNKSLYLWTTLLNKKLAEKTNFYNNYLIGKEAKIIFSKFLNLNSEKRDRIVNAAIKEFAQKGFENASTNEIVKEANISKGLLFHYFSNKKSLYLFLFDYALGLIVNDFYEKMDFTEKDIFNRLRQAAQHKFEIIQKHPEIYDFILASYFEESQDLKKHLEQESNKILTDGYKKLFQDIDITKFKEGIDVARAIDIIIWTIDGFSKRETGKLKKYLLKEVSLEDLFAEMDIYLGILINCFYK
jgi:AcrR family transcriptional regulator